MGRVCVVCIDAEACERGESAHACPDGCGGKDAVCGECYRALPKCVYCRGEAWKARQEPGPGPASEPSVDEEARGMAAACLLMIFLVLGWTTMVCTMFVVVHGPVEPEPQGEAG